MTDGFLLDTNICIYSLLGSSEVLKAHLASQPAGSLFISSISLAELAVGFDEEDPEGPDLAKFLKEILLVPFDEPAARRYGELPFRRARFDRLIAAHALALDLTLVTNNEADFADIPGLRVENWTR